MDDAAQPDQRPDRPFQFHLSTLFIWMGRTVRSGRIPRAAERGNVSRFDFCAVGRIPFPLETGTGIRLV